MLDVSNCLLRKIKLMLENAIPAFNTGVIIVSTELNSIRVTI
jgi:hypothetical protein